MANLRETAEWIDGIYQIEKTDPVVGGEGGISNRQAEQLAARTQYLKKEVEKSAAKHSPAFTGAPTAPTPEQSANNQQIATTEFVKTVIAALVGSAPAELDTLEELAAMLAENGDLRRTLLQKIGEKVNKNGDTMTGPLVLPQIHATTNDGSAENIKIGNDAWLGDTNIANAVKVKGVQDPNKGFVVFGVQTNRLGAGINYNDSNILEWEGEYLSVNALNRQTAGFDVTRKGTSGAWKSRILALPDKTWSFWVEDSHTVTIPAKGGTVLLNNDFTQHLSENGWQKLPNGLILQWGRLSARYETVADYAFNIAFPNQCFLVTATHSIETGKASQLGMLRRNAGVSYAFGPSDLSMEVNVYPLNNTHMRLWTDNDSGVEHKAISWIAIGY